MLSLNEALESEIERSVNDEPFYIADLDAPRQLYEKWRTLMPRVEPFYAVKCNCNKKLLQTYVQLGTGFDCATIGEITPILELGADPSKIIIANPIKPISAIQYAREENIKLAVFDNVSELEKHRLEYPEAELVLRIATDDTKSLHPFSTKFGAPLSDVESLLNSAKSLGLNVVGVSFHIGSGCCDASMFQEAIKNSRLVFDIALEIGFAFTLLDIGGGFPGRDDGPVKIETMAKVINEALDIYFNIGEFPYLQIIAEPGRYFSGSVFALAVNIMSRHVKETSDPSQVKYMYFVNDGVYGSFCGVLLDRAAFFRPIVVTQRGQLVSRKEPSKSPAEKKFTSTLWGPTLDSGDCILKEIQLPELELGDWLLFENIGDYAMDLATTFNGFPRPRIVYVNQPQGQSISTDTKPQANQWVIKLNAWRKFIRRNWPTTPMTTVYFFVVSAFLGYITGLRLRKALRSLIRY